MATRPKPKVNIVGQPINRKLLVVTVFIWKDAVPVAERASDWRTPDIKRVNQKRPICIHAGRQYAFENLHEAREFAKEKGYKGIRVVSG